MSAPRQEIAEFRKLMENLPGGSSPETVRDPTRRQAFLKANRLQLRSLGIESEAQFQKRHVEMQNQINDEQKGSFRKWIDQYVYSPNHPVLGTFWKLITAKPVEGVVNAVPFMPSIVGKVARWSAVAAGLYFGLGLLKGGAAASYGGGDILLDRIGPGGGHLFPGMDMPPAAPYEQALPSVDPWTNR